MLRKKSSNLGEELLYIHHLKKMLYMIRKIQISLVTVFILRVYHTDPPLILEIKKIAQNDSEYEADEE